MSIRPSAEYLAHHDVDAPRVDATAFRQGWRVRSRLAQLHTDGAISARAFVAGVQYAVDWEVAYGRGRSAPLMMMPGGGGADEHARMGQRLDAVTRLREAGDHLGPLATRLVEHCVVDDLAWAAIARTHSVTAPTARRWTIAALKHLAAYSPPPEPRTGRGA
jgi:hypothetical protein